MDHKTALSEKCHRNGPIYILRVEKAKLQLHRVVQFFTRAGCMGIRVKANYKCARGNFLG